MKQLILTLSKTELELINGKWHYKIIHKQYIDNDHPWDQRAQELRKQGLKWKQVAAQLRLEGFTTKGGEPLEMGRILNRIWYLKKVKK